MQQHIGDRIQAFLDGALDAEATEAVLAHCRACPACDRDLKDARAVWNLLAVDEAPDPDRPTYFALRERRLGTSGRLPGLVFAAASTAIALVGVMLGMQIGGVPSTEADDNPLPAYYSQGTLFSESLAFGDVYVDTSGNGEGAQ